MISSSLLRMILGVSFLAALISFWITEQVSIRQSLKDQKQLDRLDVPILSEEADAPLPKVNKEKATAPRYPNDGHPVGILSNKPASFFRELQRTIDEDDNHMRCKRYKAHYTAEKPANRRIFYGGNIANEPWELFEVVAAETYGVFAGMVFVESNRTQNYTPRPFQRLDHTDTLRSMFGTEQVEVVAHVNENMHSHLDGQDNFLSREHEQRAEVVAMWKKMGMTGNDIGLLVDMDETFTRDFFRACQVCHGLEQFDYEEHHCEHSKVKVVSVTGTFETSPECVTANRQGFHPDMILGACIEGIGDSNLHKAAPRKRKSFVRLKGLGGECDWTGEVNITDNSYSLWDMSDFRRTCGGYQIPVDTETFPEYERYTAFHFHNFFTGLNSTRFKMLTYGHPVANADTLPLHELSNDLKMMYMCAKGLPDEAKQKWKRVPGGFANVKPFLPIYFQDEDYRRRRHEFVREMVELDDVYIAALNAQ